MKVKAILNHIADLPKELQGYAFNQDEDGKIDITPGSVYDVYGIQENFLGKFYLVLTDEINHDIPWWMPTQFYEVIDETIPSHWVKKEWDNSDGRVTVYSFPVYFGAEEDIEDGTDKGFEVFAKIKIQAENNRP